MYTAHLQCGITEFFNWFTKTPEGVEKTFPEFKKPESSQPRPVPKQAPKAPTQQEALPPIRKPEISAQTMPLGPSYVNVSIVNNQDNSKEVPIIQKEVPVVQAIPTTQEELKKESNAQEVPVSSQPYEASEPEQEKVVLPKTNTILKTSLGYTKLKVVGCTIAATYTFIQGYLWYLSHMLSKASNWSLWCSHTFPEGVRSIPQVDIKAKLTETLQKSYSTAIQLNFDIEKEQAHLKRYQTLVHVLQKIYLGKLFSCNSVVLQEIPRRLYRLEQLKNAYAQAYTEIE